MKMQGGGCRTGWEDGFGRAKARVGGKVGKGVGKPVAEMEPGVCGGNWLAGHTTGLHFPASLAFTWGM